MKKILIIGGGVGQLPLIKAAKEMGYYVVVCDYANDKCPGYLYADKIYPVSTRDYDAIAEVCKKENIDGICSNSEPSMHIVAKISKSFNLIGNSTSSINTFISKSEFRILQDRLGLYCPKCYDTISVNDALIKIESMNFPIIIKPGECSGSRGNCKIESYNVQNITQAYIECMQLSRNNKVIIEEYVEMPSLTTIEGDIFVHNGQILWDGIFNTTRAKWAPMIPMTYSAPINLTENQLKTIKDNISKVIFNGGIRHGQYNIECYFTRNYDLFIIEINVRQGGNNIPLFIEDYTGINYNKLLVSTSVGDDNYWLNTIKSKRNLRNIIQHSVYSKIDGVYDGLAISEELEDKLIRVNEFISKGDLVHKCKDGSDIIATITFEFSNTNEVNYFAENLESYIKIKFK